MLYEVITGFSCLKKRRPSHAAFSLNGLRHKVFSIIYGDGQRLLNLEFLIDLKQYENNSSCATEQVIAMIIFNDGT